MEETGYIISNFSSICRLCLKKDGVMSCIFNNITDNSYSEPLHERITDFFHVQIGINDGLPTNICHRCLYKADKCAKFRLQCVNNDSKLRQLMELRDAVQQNFGEHIKQEIIDNNDENPDYDGSNSSIEAYPLENGTTRQYLDKKLNKSIVEGLDDVTISKIHGLQFPGDGHVESVVMVVDPSLEYDSTDQSDVNSDNDNDEPLDNTEFNNHEGELKNAFMCKYCDIAFRDQEKCLAHECTEHNPNAPFSCHLCTEMFQERNTFIAHMRTVHEVIKPFVCLECGKGFRRRSDLRKHTIVHTGVRPFSCPICQKSFSRNTNLTKHLRIHSGQKPHICIHCPRSFISKGDLSRHMLIHTGNKPFQCSKCELSFARKDKLQRHEKTHETTNNVPEPAKESEDSENDHDNMVVNVNPFRNEQFEDSMNIKNENELNQEFPSLPSVPDHISRDVQQLQDMMYPAVPQHITGDSFYENMGLNGGEPTEDSTFGKLKKTIKCEQCPKKFSSLATLRNHMSIHLGIRNHVCTICNKSFVRKRELDRHSVVHTGFKPFACPQCDKKFGRKDKLVRHQRIHSEFKTYHCSECHASFNRKDGLLLHQKVHAKP